MIGTRLPDLDDIYNIPLLKPGEYVRVVRQGKVDFWFATSPAGEQGNISGHSIEVHEDGTITVSPSVWFNTPTGWHGFLIKGVWKHA